MQGENDCKSHDQPEATTICQHCGEIGETFMTAEEGELCETCQRVIEDEQPASLRAVRVSRNKKADLRCLPR